MVIVCFVCLRGFVKKGCCGWRSLGLLPLSLLLLLDCASAADAQVVSQRGFVDGQGTAFFEEAPNDPTQAIADLLVREEVFVKPAAWIQFAAGLDFRANSHDQVEDDWSLDYWDR